MKAAAEYLTRAELQFDVNRSPILRRYLHDITALARRLLEQYFFKRFTGIQKICNELPGTVVRKEVRGVRDERLERLPLRWPAPSEFRCSRSAISTQARELSTDRDQTSRARFGRNLIGHYQII